MPELSGLVAYPSQPEAIGATINAALSSFHERTGATGLKVWEENDIAGRFIATPVLDNIDKGNILVADITRLNFNVAYEIGYGVGKKKRVLLVLNATLLNDQDLIRDVGIFDSLGHKKYSNSVELMKVLLETSDVSPIKVEDDRINTRAPVYILLPRMKGEAEIKIVSRVKKARLQFRSFDGEEQGRLSAREAMVNVAYSHGVIIPLLSKDHLEARTHNLRAAFVAGLANALGKALLLLQPRGDPVPLDYRDLVSEYNTVDQITEYISEFASAVTARLQAGVAPLVSEPQTFLAQLNLGASAAENEMLELGTYFLETDEYRRTLRGDTQIVTGRKGSGKTALFAQLRNKLRQDKQVVVLDLKPEGFQLLKFKELVLDLLQGGTKEHTITAFWEYLLLLEICHKLLEMDKELHLRDHRIFEAYQNLSYAYREDAFIAEGDFAERMLRLTQTISDDFRHTVRAGDAKWRLSSPEITELLYKHDVAKLRAQLTTYLTKKEAVWVLFDNLDKGWPAHGVKPDDLITVRCLLDALAKLDRDLRKRDIYCRGIIFIRNDIYELLVETTPDRGKTSRVVIDWTDPELLRELLRRRFVSGNISQGLSFDEIWRQICISHIEGEESSQYMIDRCLMRPRSLIDLLQYCRSHAVNLGHHKIEADDIRLGEEAYSTDVAVNLQYEIRDVCPEATDVLYEFMGMPAVLRHSQIRARIYSLVKEEQKADRILDLLLWYGVVGLKRETGEVTYIYSVKYDIKRLKALIQKCTGGEPIYYVNPAFWKALEIRADGA